MQSQKDAEELRCTFLKQRVNAAHLYADGHDPIEREKTNNLIESGVRDKNKQSK